MLELLPELRIAGDCMSDYRFGSGDYGLSIYPTEAFDGIGGFDIDMVERVEIEGVDFVRERTCKPIIEQWDDPTKYDAYCGNCNYPLGDGELEPWNYCPNCGVKVVGE